MTGPSSTRSPYAAAGGVGSLAVQLAKPMGAGRVIATASTEEKRALALELGADAAVDVTRADLADALREANLGERVDVVVVQRAVADHRPPPLLRVPAGEPADQQVTGGGEPAGDVEPTAEDGERVGPAVQTGPQPGPPQTRTFCGITSGNNCSCFTSG